MSAYLKNDLEDVKLNAYNLEVIEKTGWLKFFNSINCYSLGAFSAAGWLKGLIECKESYEKGKRSIELQKEIARLENLILILDKIRAKKIKMGT